MHDWLVNQRQNAEKCFFERRWWFNKRKCLFVSNRSDGTSAGEGYCFPTLVTAQWFSKLFDRMATMAELQHFTLFLKGKAKVESLPWAHCLPFAKVCHELYKCVWMLGWLMYLPGIIVMLAGQDLHASNPKLSFSGCRGHVKDIKRLEGSSVGQVASSSFSIRSWHGEVTPFYGNCINV